MTKTRLFGLLSALTLYYAFVSSAGTFGLLVWHMDFYDQLSEGFRAGHLYLPTQPEAALLARDNPYTWQSPDDWDAWLWDASLYNGHYYLYWGPTPALLLWIFKALSGYSGTIHDQWLVLIFSALRLYAGAGLITLYARSQYPGLPRWAPPLAILVFALASPTPYVLARPVIYEACIACGQGFLCLALYAAYRGLLQPLAQTRWFVAAGSCLACALSARASLIISAPLVIAATAFCATRSAGYRLRKVLGALLALGGPVACGLLLYAAYNQLRFDAFYEFGLKYQLTGRPFETADRFFLPNLASYLWAELSWSCRFPFVRLPGTRHLTSWIPWPADYDLGSAENGERVGGVLVATSFSWLWAVYGWRALAWAKQRSARSSVPRAWSDHELWLILSSLAVIASAAPASRVYLASMRYLQDAASGIVLGAIGAGFWLLRPSKRRRLAPVVYCGLALHSIFVGVGLGFTGYADTFRKENTALFEQLERKLSVCGIKHGLRQLVVQHALPSFESAAIYVASEHAQHIGSRDTCQERPTARP